MIYIIIQGTAFVSTVWEGQESLGDSALGKGGWGLETIFFILLFFIRYFLPVPLML